ncbi:unnamed protein product [Urochloa humidicola]
MSRVCCVTGAAGYIGSWLVRKLLGRGCTVHATLRNLGDESKTALLRGFPGAAERLVLFEADIYDAARFEPAIAGCEFVFLVAMPMAYDAQGGSKAYVFTKTLSEKELLKYNDSPNRAFDVVSLVCGLVGGDSALPYAPTSMLVMLSPLTGDEICHNNLKFMQALHGAVPLVHVDDVCEAHVLCMEGPPTTPPAVAAGRFLCAAGYPNMRDVVDHYARRHPELKLRIAERRGEGAG